MPLSLEPRPTYTRSEYISDAAVHVLGLVTAMMAVPVLITLAAVLSGEVSVVLGATIYGVCLIAMILCSALYNMVPPGRWTGLLQRLDHSAIYFKIAGTYTPFTMLSGAAGGYLLAGLWGAAVAGTGLKVIAPNRFRWLCLGLYLGMGWGGFVAGRAVFEAMPGRILALIAVGGLLYTAGVAFYLAKKMPYHNTIWHVFVLAASVVFYVAVTMQVVETAGLAAL